MIGSPHRIRDLEPDEVEVEVSLKAIVVRRAASTHVYPINGSATLHVITDRVSTLTVSLSDRPRRVYIC